MPILRQRPANHLSENTREWGRAARYGWFALLFAALLVMALIRLRLLDFPLERDEGEFAYGGRLLLQGRSLYQECHTMKWPGAHCAFAAIMLVFGETSAGIHLGLLFVCLASSWLVFLIGRSIGGDAMGAVAASLQALFTINPAVLGFAAHATHFVVVFALAGVWVMMAPWEQLRWTRCMAAGALWGIACTMKQPGVVFGMFGMVWLFSRGLVERSQMAGQRREILTRLGGVALGGSLVLALMFLMLAVVGAFPSFWHWTVEYARAYGGTLTISEGIDNLISTGGKIWSAAPWLWVLIAIGSILIWAEPTLKQWRGYLIAFTGLSFIGVGFGWHFRSHYFLMFVPALALICGAGCCAWIRLAERSMPRADSESGTDSAQGFRRVRRRAFAIAAQGGFAVLFVAAIGHSLIVSSDIFFRLSPVRACREVYGANPFPEAMEIGRYLADHCSKDARIAVMGSEPEIYFYSHCPAATGYVYTDPLMEPQPFASEMQHEMINEIERAAPEYLVVVSVPASWLAGPTSDTTIFTWMQRYCSEYMELEGVADIVSPTKTEYRWSLANQLPTPRPGNWLGIYKRKPARSKMTIQIGNTSL